MAEATADTRFVSKRGTYRAQIEAATERFRDLIVAAGHWSEPEPEPDPIPEWQRVFIAINVMGEGAIPVQRYPSVKDIINVVANYYGFTKIDLISARRKYDITHARHVAMYLARQLTPRSMPQIGKALGNRDHTTILHGVQKIERLIASDPDSELARDIAAIRDLFEQRKAAE